MTTQAMTQAIAEYFKTQPVLKAWLFGSYARGEERPDSDVDIMVDYDRNQRIGLFKISGMQLALQELIGHEVDLVDAEMMFPSVAKYANRDKKLIYERANQGQGAWKVIANMRHHIVHGYYRVNAKDVWDVIQDDLEPLRQQVETILTETDWSEWEENGNS